MRDLQTIFICYAHQDKRWLKWLDTFLSPLIRNGKIISWSDRQIISGKDWKSEITATINRCGIAIVLTSPSFIASDFIHNNELPPLLKAAKEEGLVLLNIVLRPCDFDDLPFLKSILAINDLQEPLAALSGVDRDIIGNKLAKTIKGYLSDVDNQTLDQSTLPDSEPITDFGFLDHKFKGNEALDNINNLLLSFGEYVTAMAQTMRERAQQIEVLISKGEEKLIYQTVNAHALEISGFANKMEGKLPAFKESADAFSYHFKEWLVWRKAQGFTDDNGFRVSIPILIDSLDLAIKNISNYKEQILGLKGTALSINNAAQKAGSAMTKLIELTNKLKLTCEEIITLL